MGLKSKVGIHGREAGASRLPPSMQIILTELERRALETPIYVAHENTRLALIDAQCKGNKAVEEWLHARFNALDKLREALAFVEEWPQINSKP